MLHFNLSKLLPLAAVAFASLPSAYGAEAIYADTMVTIFKGDSTQQVASLPSAYAAEAVYADTMITIFKGDSTPQGNT